MPEKPNSETLNVLLTEYGKVKDEQIHRIGFRDNLLYVNLATVGGIVSLSVSNASNITALLLIPWASLILGWTYLVNDEKISALGRYVRSNLDERIRKEINSSEAQILGWEIQHRSDDRRRQRKILQLLIDEIAFCLSSLAAIGLYFMLDVTPHPPLLLLIIVVESVLILVLAYQIAFYADFGRGK